MRAMINSDIEMVDDMVAGGVSIKTEPTDLISFCNDDVHTEDESSSSSSSVPAPPTDSDSSDGDNPAIGSDRVAVESLDPCRESVIFHPQTIQVIAEQSEIHENLTEDVAHLISEDVSYRLRELTHSAAQMMRHSFRKKLTTIDVFKAMQELDCDLIFGHNNVVRTQASRAQYFSEVPLAEVFVPNDSFVDLKKEAARILARDATCGHGLNFAPVHSFEIEWFSMVNSSCDNFCAKSVQIDEYFTKLIQTLLPSEHSRLSSLERDRCLKIFYLDLMNNSRLKPLLCPLFYFIRNTLIAWDNLPGQRDSVELQRIRLESTKAFLNVLHAITWNDTFVDLTLNSRIIQDFADTLLIRGFGRQEPCLKIESYFKLYHHILDVRSSIAYQFSQLLYKFSIPFTDAQHRLLKMFYIKIVEHIETKVENLIHISAIDFTILRMFRFLGFDMCLRYLLPLLVDNLSPFSVYFSDDIEDGSSKSRGIMREVKNQIKMEIGLLGKFILKGLVLLFVQKPNDVVQVEQSGSIYSYFYDHFGDSLCYSIATIADLPTAAVVGALRSKKRKKPNNVVETSSNHAESMEKSPNKSHKKKGSGLLESMLSTDTTKMAKNESLSMFTDSLLESAKKQYKKMQLYQQDFDDSSYPADIQCLIVFDGKRLPPKNEEDDDTTPKRVRIHSTTVLYKNSDWYNLSLNYRPRNAVPLPCCRQLISAPDILTDSDSRIRKSRSFDPIRHQNFHYHRLRHHLRTSCSLYTHV